MSVGVLFAGTMLVCCLGLISGGPADEDQNRYVIEPTHKKVMSVISNIIDYMTMYSYVHCYFTGHTITLDITPLADTDQDSNAALRPHNKDPHRGGKPLFII